MDRLSKYWSSFLKAEIELTQEREEHIARQHPDLLPEYKKHIIKVIGEPDEIRRSKRFGNALLFSRWFEDVRDGKYVVVVVVSESQRHWVITAYMARKLVKGEIVWKKN